MKLPKHIEARRIGVYAESEYDEFGELAPVTWVCGCTRRLRTERFDDDDECYVPVSDERRAAWLAEHANCKTTCYKCRVTEVDYVDLWCDACQQAAG